MVMSLPLSRGPECQKVLSRPQALLPQAGLTLTHVLAVVVFELSLSSLDCSTCSVCQDSPCQNRTESSSEACCSCFCWGLVGVGAGNGPRLPLMPFMNHTLSHYNDS